MKHGKYFIYAALIVVLLAAWTMNASKGEADTAPAEEPAHVEPIEGTELSRIVLTERAAERLDIQTAGVTEQQVDGQARLVAPYSSIIYDPDGSTWVYTSPEPLVYVRHAVTIEAIRGEEAILAEGPKVGTKVVSVGGALLYGTEHGVGH